MPYGPPPWEGSKRARKSGTNSGTNSGTEPVRITVDLTPDDYQLLNVWLARASVELDQPVSSMTLARGIKAMIRAAASDNVVNDVVLNLLRRDQP